VELWPERRQAIEISSLEHARVADIIQNQQDMPMTLQSFSQTGCNSGEMAFGVNQIFIADTIPEEVARG